MAKFIKIYFRNRKITTVSELLNQDKCENISVSDFLDYKNPFNEKKNRQILFETYTEQQKKELGLQTAEDIKDGTKIYPPGIFYVPVDNVPIDIIKYESQFVQSRDYNAFLSEAIKKIVNASDYIKSNQVYKFTAQCRVFIWSKSIAINNVENSVIDFSPTIINCTVTVTENGGSFQITLPPLPSSKLRSAFVSTDLIDNDKPNQAKTLDFRRKNIFGNGAVIKYDFNNNLDYTSNTITSNDIVFIKFERLLNDYETIVGSENANYIFPNQIWDLIGLVDTVTKQENTPNEISVSISGRDLIKILIDDGSFFFSNSYTDNSQQDGIFINQSRQGDSANTTNNWVDGSQAMNRMSVTGLIIPLFNPTGRTIEYVMDLIVKTLSNIQICPDSVFEFYGDKRTEFNKIYEKTVMESKIENETFFYPDKPISTNINVFGDINSVLIDNRVITSEQLRNAQTIYTTCLNNGGSNRDAKIGIMAAIQESRLINRTGGDRDSVGLFQQRPSQGWGSQTELLNPELSSILFFLGKIAKGIKGLFHYENRDKYSCGEAAQKVQRSAFPKLYSNWEKQASILCNYFAGRYVLGELDTEQDTINYTDSKTEITTTKEFAHGIWQIVKLIIDDSVKDRVINDACISFMQGSLLNFVNKVCQKPFVEFFTDTYGDQFYFIVRKPPFTKQSFQSLVTIDVLAENVLAENLSWNTEEIYSWYQLIPDGNYIGSESNIWSYQSAVFFSPYAEIWGSRPYSITSNYITFLKNEDKVQTQYIIEDLRFLIDTHAYLPFTKKGNITIVGDRRIKKGMRIYYAKTNEYYYVDNVSNSFSANDGIIERVTNLTVSRGMIRDYVDVEIEDENTISYFNLINFGDNQYKPTTQKLQQEAQAKEVNTTLNHQMCKFNYTENSYTPESLNAVGNNTQADEELMITQADINVNDSNINQFIEIAYQYKNVSFDLIGFSDSVEARRFGTNLSELRANSVREVIKKRYQEKYNADEKEMALFLIRLNIVIGEQDNTANLTKEGRAQNRRVEVYVKDTYKKEDIKSDTLKSPKDGNWHVNLDVFKFFINSCQFI